MGGIIAAQGWIHRWDLQLPVSPLLDEMHLVLTLMQRGAVGSPGKTTWTGRAELADYVSIEAFMICYLACLRKPQNFDSISPRHEAGPPAVDAEGVKKSPTDPAQHANSSCGRVICAGYSYGSIMARRAPTGDALADSLLKATAGSVEEEVFLRAAHLANLHHEKSALEQRGRADSSPGAVAMGGQENAQGASRVSREHSHHSFKLENIRDRIEIFRNRSKSGRVEGSQIQNETTRELKILERLSDLETSYLLISPPLSFGVSLITAFAGWAFESKVGSFRHLATSTKGDPEDRLVHHQSFAVWGERDVLQSSHHLRKWANDLEARKDSAFTWREIPRAGHFWREEGVIPELKQAVTEWLARVEETPSLPGQ